MTCRDWRRGKRRGRYGKKGRSGGEGRRRDGRKMVKHTLRGSSGDKKRAQTQREIHSDPVLSD